MSEARVPDKDKAKQDYLNGMKYKDIAQKYNVSINTVKSWVKRYGWSKAKNKRGAHKNKGCGCTQNNKDKPSGKSEHSSGSQDDGLTEKERFFCLYYIKNFNATQAAIKAGYSEKYPSEIGYQLLHKTTVRKEVERLKELKRKSIMIDEDDIIERYMRIAFADITDFVEFGQRDVPLITKDGVVTDENGEAVKVKDNVVNFKDCNEVDGGLISEVRKGRQGISIKLEDRQGISIKLEDRQKALKWLADFFEMNPEHKYRKEHDAKKLELERERFEHQKKTDELKAW